MVRYISDKWCTIQLKRGEETAIIQHLFDSFDKAKKQMQSLCSCRREINTDYKKEERVSIRIR